MTRHIGAFILNVLKPAIEELDKLLGKCQHLKLDNSDIYDLLNGFAKLQIYKLIIKCITLLLSLLIGCYFFTR